MLAGLRLADARIDLTRWAEKETVDDWSQGVPLAYQQEVCAYWADGYDFAAAQARLHRFPQFRHQVDGLGIHFLHVRSKHADAMPLLLAHTYPGSQLDFLDMIDPLVDPEAHGGSADQAFHLVIPSMPGFGFSTPVVETG